MTIFELYEDFLRSRQLLGCSSRTIEDYTYFLNRFIKWCGGQYDVENLTLKLFDDYTLYLLNSDIKRVTVRTYLTHLRAFYRWSVDEDYIDVDVSKLRLPKKHTDVIDTLSDTEISRLLDCFAPLSASFCSDRNRLIIMCMLDCGFRRSDVLNLRVSDVSDNHFVLNGKGNKRRIVPFGSQLRVMLYDYMMMYRPSGYLFTTEDGRQLTKWVINNLFRKLRKKSGIARLHPHLLRHTFATNYLYSGGNLEMLRLILGHTDLKTTQIYLHLADTKRLLSQQHLSYFDMMGGVS